MYTALVFFFIPSTCFLDRTLLFISSREEHHTTHVYPSSIPPARHGLAPAQTPPRVSPPFPSSVPPRVRSVWIYRRTPKREIAAWMGRFTPTHLALPKPSSKNEKKTKSTKTKNEHHSLDGTSDRGCSLPPTPNPPARLKAQY